MATTSRWRAHAIAVVSEAMTWIPKRALESEIRAALRPLYPFGERRYYPYKQWCKVVNEAVRKRLPNMPARKRDLVPRLKLAMPRKFNAASRYIPNYQWTDCVEVYCPFCPKRKYQESCMMCGDLWAQAKRLNSQTLSAWIVDATVKADPLIWGQIRDYFQDRGHDELAEQTAKMQAKYSPYGA